ncbi:MAG: hypothetical protein HYX52_03185 [Chloroflexi bacterium]|nr:hypothetical protein [Chloroflexota bacterium]
MTFAPGRLRLKHVWALAAVVATLPANACTPTAIVDLGWTIQSGAWMLERGSVLVEDPFTWAPRATGVVDQQWLAQVLFATWYRAGGFPLVIGATALAASAAYALILAAGLARGAGWRTAAALTVAAYLLGATNLGARAQTLAYPLLGLVLLAAALRRRGSMGRVGRWAWRALPLLFALWANLHGSYPLGLLVLLAEALGRSLEQRSARAERDRWLHLGSCVLATLVTPFGLGGWAYLAGIGGNPIIRNLVAEWAPPPVGSYSGALLYLSLAVVASRALSRRRPLATADWITLASFGALALLSSRAVAWWGLAATPVVASLLATPGALPRAPERREMAGVNWAIAMVLLGLAALSLPWTKSMNPLLPANLRGFIRPETPTALAEALSAMDSRAIFNESTWGGYIDFALWPKQRAFVDGRIELYPQAVWDDYVALTYPVAGWQSIADRYRFDALVLDRRLTPELMQAAAASLAWRPVYEDERGIIFQRVSP